MEFDNLITTDTTATALNTLNRTVTSTQNENKIDDTVYVVVAV